MNPTSLEDDLDFHQASGSELEVAMSTTQNTEVNPEYLSGHDPTQASVDFIASTNRHLIVNVCHQTKLAPSAERRKGERNIRYVTMSAPPSSGEDSGSRRVQTDSSGLVVNRHRPQKKATGRARRRNKAFDDTNEQDHPHPGRSSRHSASGPYPPSPVVLSRSVSLGTPDVAMTSVLEPAVSLHAQSDIEPYTSRTSASLARDEYERDWHSSSELPAGYSTNRSSFQPSLEGHADQVDPRNWAEPNSTNGPTTADPGTVASTAYASRLDSLRLPSRLPNTEAYAHGGSIGQVNITLQDTWPDPSLVSMGKYQMGEVQSDSYASHSHSTTPATVQPPIIDSNYGENHSERYNFGGNDVEESQASQYGSGYTSTGSTMEIPVTEPGLSNDQMYMDNHNQPSIHQDHSVDFLPSFFTHQSRSDMVLSEKRMDDSASDAFENNVDNASQIGAGYATAMEPSIGFTQEQMLDLGLSRFELDGVAGHEDPAIQVTDNQDSYLNMNEYPPDLGRGIGSFKDSDANTVPNDQYQGSVYTTQPQPHVAPYATVNTLSTDSFSQSSAGSTPYVSGSTPGTMPVVYPDFNSDDYASAHRQHGQMSIQDASITLVVPNAQQHHRDGNQYISSTFTEVNTAHRDENPLPNLTSNTASVIEDPPLAQTRTKLEDPLPAVNKVDVAQLEASSSTQLNTVTSTCPSPTASSYEHYRAAIQETIKAFRTPARFPRAPFSEAAAEIVDDDQALAAFWSAMSTTFRRSPQLQDQYTKLLGEGLAKGQPLFGTKSGMTYPSSLKHSTLPPEWYDSTSEAARELARFLDQSAFKRLSSKKYYPSMALALESQDSSATLKAAIDLFRNDAHSYALSNANGELDQQLKSVIPKDVWAMFEDVNSSQAIDNGSRLQVQFSTSMHSDAAFEPATRYNGPLDQVTLDKLQLHRSRIAHGSDGNVEFALQILKLMLGSKETLDKLTREGLMATTTHILALASSATTVALLNIISNAGVIYDEEDKFEDAESDTGRTFYGRTRRMHAIYLGKCGLLQRSATTTEHILTYPALLRSTERAIFKDYVEVETISKAPAENRDSSWRVQLTN